MRTLCRKKSRGIDLGRPFFLVDAGGGRPQVGIQRNQFSVMVSDGPVWEVGGRESVGEYSRFYLWLFWGRRGDVETWSWRNASETCRCCTVAASFAPSLICSI